MTFSVEAQQRVQGFVEGLSSLFAGFSHPGYSKVEPSEEFNAMTEALIATKQAKRSWVDREEWRAAGYRRSRIADWLLISEAEKHGFMVDKRDVPGYDFTLLIPCLGREPDRIRIETKKMETVFQRQIAFKDQHHESNSLKRWETYDVLLAWTVTSEDVFKPWALIANYVMSEPFWKLLWKPNKHNYGKHLLLTDLSDKDYRLL